MIKNFITYTDLIKKEPRLVTDWQTSTTIIGTQIADAYKKTIIELNKRNIDTRCVMIPFYLASGKQTLSASSTGTGILAQTKNRVKRLVIEKSTCTDGGGGNTWTLEGSNDNTVWTTIVTLANTTGAGVISVSFDDEYDYYRYKLTVATSLSFTGYIYLVENSFDDLIQFKSLEIIFRSLMRIDNDLMSQKYIAYKSEFDSEIKSLRYSYDVDNSGTIDDDEEVRKKTTSVRISL